MSSAFYTTREDLEVEMSTTFSMVHVKAQEREKNMQPIETQ